MRSVAIVGLGWLGFPLARYLKSLGWEVKGSKRTHEGVETMHLRRLECYQLELTPEIDADPDDLAALFDVDALVINIPPSEYFFNTDSYVTGIQNLVQEALLSNIEHIIFISSTSIFPQQSATFSEEDLPVPSTEVGKALLSIEQSLLNLQDIDVDILRLSGLVGDDRHPVHHLSGRENLANAKQPVNLVHITDCIRAIQLLLETPSYQRLYHLSAPSHPTREEYYCKMAEIFAIPAPHFALDQGSPQRIITGDKICQELDFIYQYPDPYQMLPSAEEDYIEP